MAETWFENLFINEVKGALKSGSGCVECVMDVKEEIQNGV